MYLETEVVVKVVEGMEEEKGEEKVGVEMVEVKEEV